MIVLILEREVALVIFKMNRPHAPKLKTDYANR